MELALVAVMAKPSMSREQFEHIKTVLEKKKIKPTAENIVKYMLKTSNQKSKFYDRIKEEEAEKANQARQAWASYISSIQFRIRLLFWHIVLYKKGYKGRFGRLDIIRAKSRKGGDRHPV